MKPLKKLLVPVLVLLTLNLCLPKTAFCQQDFLYTKADITEHPPQSRTTRIEDMPGKKGRSWLWWLVGLVVVAGVAAAGASGGDDGGGGDDPPPDDPDEGEVTGTW